MAEHMVSPLFSAVQTIGKLLFEEGKFLGGVKDQAEELYRRLDRIQWFLKEADAKKIEADRIRRWILEANDIAFDAQDLLETYAFKVGSQVSDGSLQVLQQYTIQAYSRHRLGSKIQALNSRMLNLTRSLQEFGVMNVPEMSEAGSSSVQQQLRRTYSFLEEEDFVGFDSDVDLLANHLVNENEHYRVVSIYGMGGSGKTTLANKVYKHPNVKRYFNGFAWICVSQQWQTKDILQRIMIKLEPEKRKQIEKQWREDELISNLLNVQQQRRCLIVLDDVWKTDAWDCIKVAFPTGQNGSKILLTTRNREVASHIDRDGFQHQPRLLNDDESWELLRRKALRERNDEGHHMRNTNLINEVEKLGKKMVKRCGGLPLAVIVLGGILSTKDTLSEWEIVLQNIKSYIWQGKSFRKDKGELEKILALSYHDLPFQLKPCFLYLGCFPEDADIDANTLYQLWTAEGLVLTEDRAREESMMELVERYLGELGQRGMVRLQTLEFPGLKRFKSCRLHDLMRDFCLHEADHECFLNYSSQGKGKNVETFDSLSASICKLRRFVIDLEDKDVYSYNFHRKGITKYLRMLRFSVLGDEAEMAKLHLNNFEMLRSLSIEGFRPQLGDTEDCCCTMWCCCSSRLKLPKEIGKLIHLRYLSLRRSYFVVVPSSLGNLKHLQTLDLRLSCGCRLPNILWKMKELTCLYLPDSIKKQWCRVRLHGLEKLEILENFKDTDCETEDLLQLTSLRVLSVGECISLENLKMIANYAESNNRLEQVSIFAYCDFNLDREEEGLRILKQLLFGRNIHTLYNWGKMWKFPEYEPNMSSNLVILTLGQRGLYVEGGIFRTLEKFSHLRELTLWHFKGREMSFHAMGFPQLRQLSLWNFKELERWVVEEGAMPNLRLLQISDCRALEAIPDGLLFITTLEEFRIDGVSQKLIERI